MNENNNNDFQQYHNSIKNIYKCEIDVLEYNIESLIFNSLDKQSILENGFYKKDQFKPGILNKFLIESSNRIMFNMFYPLIKKFNRENKISIENVEFDQVHFEWNNQLIFVSPIDVLLISSKSKVLYFLECKHLEPMSNDKFQFSNTYLEILKNKGYNNIYDFLVPYIEKYDCLNNNNLLFYGAGISQNLRQLMSIMVNKGKFQESKKPYQFTNYILDINPDFNTYDIWFGNLLYFDNFDDNQAGKYFIENHEFSDNIREDLLKFGIKIKSPITYKTIFKSSKTTYDSIKNNYTLSEYLEHNYFKNLQK